MLAKEPGLLSPFFDSGSFGLERKTVNNNYTATFINKNLITL